MNVNDALPEFIAESNDLLKEMEVGLLACGQSAEAETINLIFRCAHTIKGSAGLFGLEHIVHFMHVMETVLDLVRQGRQPISDELVTLLLKCKDHVAELIGLVQAAEEPAAELEQRCSVLRAELLRIANLDSSAPSHAPTSGSAVRETDADAAATLWQVSVQFAPEILKAGMDPIAFVRYLATFATLESVSVLDSALPSPEHFDPELCYLAFDITLRTTAPRERIESAFEFVREDCTLRITQLSTTAQAAAAAEAAGTSGGSGATDNGKRAAGAASIRVDAHKLDRLITHIGELIIAAAAANLAARRAGKADIEEHTSTVAALVEEVRESALQLRMVKIGGVFDRFKRVVRDLSHDLGKTVELEIRGEETELDKTLVERIADPLTHLVRNAMDHGIEPTQVRTARGKSAAGRLTLNAYHDSGSIVIEVSDDGGGLKRERILAKAIERGLIEPGRELSDEEVFDLIFEPGFSTAEQITNLSGRGVGMDVVKRNITALRGSIDLRSDEGVGTTVSIRLPLTLAIINGFQVAVGESRFVLPLESIDECVELASDTGHDFADLRGEVLPFVRLRELFGTRDPAVRRESIVVVRHGAQRAGLVVDSLLGESQTVIKPLGKVFRKASCVTGSSILGNGEVALILDVPALVRQAAGRAQSSSVIRVRG